MNVICPIFPESSSEADLLRKSYSGEPYLDYALRRLCKEDDVRLNILTNHKEIYEHLEDEGFNVFWVDAGAYPELDFGSFACFRLPLLRKRLGDMLLDSTDELVLLDIRFPLLTYSQLDSALDQYRRSKKKAVMSVSQPVDHPAQIETFFSHIQTDIISMTDTGFDVNRFVEDAVAKYGLKYPASAFSGICFSKPFFFNWEDYGIQPEFYNSLIYRVFEEGQHSWARPYPGTDGLGHLARQPAGKYYLFENSKHARRLYPYAELKTDRGKIITGLSFSRNLEVCRCLLSGGEDGSSARVCLHEKYVGNNYLMRIESNTALHGDDSADAVLVDIDRHIAGTSVLEALDARFHETDIQLDLLMPLDHWIITIMKNVSCGTADISQPIQLGNVPWHTDPRTKRKYDPVTKMELTGRQLLPKVCHLDGAFLIADRLYMSRLESGIDYNDTEGFFLPDPISRRIESEIDFLRSI